eukprot:m.73199 g.73199  ORF g.73199 m.73199 type:complete len:799 (+) comp24536_c0_seq1:174-2570(+)
MGKKGPDDAFVPVEVNVQDPRTLIVTLKSPEPLVAGKAARSLEKFANLSEKNKADLVGLGVIEAACPLLSHQDLELKAQVAGMLATVTESEVARKAIKKYGLDHPNNCTAPMVQLLKEEEGLISNENAGGYFANFATEFSGRVQIFEAGGLEELIALLVRMVPDPADAKAAKNAPQTPDLLRNTLQALSLLCDEHDARAALGKGDTGGVETLLVVLDSEYNELQSLALKCLLAATRITRNRMIVRVSGGLVKLIEFINKPEFQATHAQALNVLACLLNESAAMVAVSERGAGDKKNPAGFPAPVELFADFVKLPDTTTAVAALRCVTNAGKNAVNRRVLSMVKIEAAVASRLWSDNAKEPLNPGVGLAATQAVIVLCESEVCSANLGVGGAIPKLVNLLTWESEPCAQAAAAALAAITRDVDDNRVMLVDADGVQKVAALFDTEVTQKWGNAADILFNLAASVKTRAAVVGVEALLPGLLKCVNSGEQAVIESGLRLLTNLAKDVSFRAQIAASNDICGCLLTLAQHEIFTIKLETWRAMRACATDREASAALCERGALNVLSSIDNEFAQAAFNQLLECNLSAKYAFRGRLDVTNLVNAKFYDAGALNLSDEFQTLESLSKADIGADRETLVVDVESTEGPLVDLIKSCQSNLKENSTQVEMAVVIAKAVSDRLGGQVSLSSASNFSHDLAMSELKLKLESNVVPLEQVTQGNYYHRALLFKVVGDQLGLLSTLVRGDYGRAYNVIHQPHFAVVDVMHSVGALFELRAHGPSPADLGDLQLPGNFFEFASAQDKIEI